MNTKYYHNNNNNKNSKQEDVEMPKNINSYLGQKGYTVLKSDLTIKQLTFIKEQLMVKPYMPGSPVQVQKSFPAYRESDKKLYLPRYYGEELFGPSKDFKLTEGDNIDLLFQGTLRPVQEPVVAKYLKHVANGGAGLLELPCGFGKCLKKDTPILMFDGNIKMVQDIQVGEHLMGDDSTSREVLSLAAGRETMYKISNKMGDEYTVNESHILSLKCARNISRAYKKGDIVDISVKNYLHLPKIVQNKLRGYKVPVVFTNNDTESLDKLVDLYLFGFKLNNMGPNAAIPHIYKCSSRENQLKLLAGLIDSNGYSRKKYYIIDLLDENKTLVDDIIFLCRSLGFSCYTKFKTQKVNNNSVDNIVSIFIYGNNLDEIPTITQKNIEPVKSKNNHLEYRITLEKLPVDDYYGFEINGNKRFVLGDFTVTHNTSISLYLLSQLKKKTLVIVHKEFLMNQWVERIQQFLPMARIGKIQGQVIDIEGKEIVLCMLQSLVLKDYPASLFDCFGFTILDEVHHISSETFSNALFKVVTKYMLGLSATMDRKDGTTKIFKMFLGEVIHKVERKDEYAVEVRAVTYKTNDEEFNETILDFKGQPQISSMISKLCTYNRRTEFIIQTLTDFLCSETVDKETIKQHKLNMDEANPCCKMCLKNNNYLLKNTCCQCVKYCLPCLNNIVEDSKKPVVTTDKNGNEKVTKRRAKCPECNKVLAFEQNYIPNPYLKPMSDRHIIVMSHNLNVLDYMYNKFVCKNLASVGYYVGGMSEPELKHSEKQQVIFASFSMCSEGLDIPTLNTEFLITPKTDVVQIVGRILRAKHATCNPIIYDFVDSHDVFQRQWVKRKAYFKKNNYRIIQTNSFNYSPDTSSWKVVFEPGGKPVDKKEVLPCSSSSENDSDEVFDEEDETTSKPSAGKCFLKIKK
jgi:superfamily II DNA or RNA helicase